MGRKYGDVVGQAAQPHLQRAQRFQRELHCEMRAEQVGACDGADHDGAAREQRPWTVAVDQEVAQMVRRVTGRMQGLEGEVPEPEIAAGRQLADVGARRGLQLAPAGHEVVVQVGVQDVGDLDAQPIGNPQIRGYIAEWIDDQGHPAVAVGDQEARVAQLRGWDCFDCEHRLFNPAKSARSSGARRW